MLGLLRDDRRSGTALTVLDRCRIRWGELVAVTGLAPGDPLTSSTGHWCCSTLVGASATASEIFWVPK
ncbi:hypothetical protein E3T29_15010 [Cryobacterium sp. TMT1-66-1]|nr:hypothetical protein E3T29_15010 [Cryobacterium sp. TMT1-66-1]